MPADHPPHAGPARPGITEAIAAFATAWRPDMVPERIRAEAARAFLNWVGCALGGSQEPVVALAAATAAELGGAPRASLIGRQNRTDMASAAFVNCVASSCLAFDDAHLATVTHPSGPVAAALFAFCEGRTVRGDDFLAALALGMEVTCRLSNVLLLPPARFNLGFYVTGLTAPIGVAVALGNLLRLDHRQMGWAIGIAASQSSGFRASHGTMTAHFRPGHAARSGVWAAVLASKGFTCAPDILETDKGFLDVYSAGADPGHMTEGLGQRFEMLANTYKPYPCGIVINPTIDACLDIRQRLPPGAGIAAVSLRVHPLALRLTGLRDPADTLEAHVSLFHWAAAALVRGTAGLAEAEPACIAEPAVAALRHAVRAIGDPALKPGEAVVEVRTDHGTTLHAHVTEPRGSMARPMTDDELDAKFKAQATPVLGSARAEELRAVCRATWSDTDVGATVGTALAIPARGADGRPHVVPRHPEQAAEKGGWG